MVADGTPNSWISENNYEPENNSEQKHTGVWISIVILIIAIIGIIGWFTYNHIQSEKQKKTDMIYLFSRGGDEYYCLDDFTMYDNGHVVGTVYVPDGCSVDFSKDMTIAMRIHESERNKGRLGKYNVADDFYDVDVVYPSTTSEYSTLTIDTFFGNPVTIYKIDTEFLGYYNWVEKNKEYS